MQLTIFSTPALVWSILRVLRDIAVVPVLTRGSRESTADPQLLLKPLRPHPQLLTSSKPQIKGCVQGFIFGPLFCNILVEDLPADFGEGLHAPESGGCRRRFRDTSRYQCLLRRLSRDLPAHPALRRRTWRRFRGSIALTSSCIAPPPFKLPQYPNTSTFCPRCGASVGTGSSRRFSPVNAA